MKKIPFNDKCGLTQAVLKGRKTHTRRIITTNLYNRVDWKAFEEGNYDCVITDDASTVTDIRDYAAYRIGEEVAVAQSYSVCNRAVCLTDSPGWNNKMFVRADLMPHRIRITNVRVERLQDISDEDCLKEGIVAFPNTKMKTIYSFGDGGCFTTARLAFAALIDKTCGRGTWDSNPYVFVYEFELKK